MPHMTDERVRAGLAREEDLSLLHEVSMKTAGVSHLEMCIQCGTCGGSCPVAMDMDHRVEMAFRAYDPCFGCATHSLPGQMPLEITIRNAAGAVVDLIKQFC
jgi:ferredoxin